MKKITQSSVPGGAPIYLDDFKGPFNDEIWDAMQALLSAYDADVEGLIIQGCVVGGAGPYTLSAGIVYLNGEFMRIDAQTGLSLPQYIQPLSAVNTSRQFEDSSTQVLFIEKSATVSGSAPGAGQYVAITTTTDPDDRRLRLLGIPDGSITASFIASGQVTKSSDGVQLLTKVLSIGDWNMDSSEFAVVTHGLSDITKIRSISVIVIADGSANVYDFISVPGSTDNINSGQISGVNSTQITLRRAPTGTFDSTSFNDTGFNRGYVTITYQA